MLEKLAELKAELQESMSDQYRELLESRIKRIECYIEHGVWSRP